MRVVDGTSSNPLSLPSCEESWRSDRLLVAPHRVRPFAASADTDGSSDVVRDWLQRGHREKVERMPGPPSRCLDAGVAFGTPPLLASVTGQEDRRGVGGRGAPPVTPADPPSSCPFREAREGTLNRRPRTRQLGGSPLWERSGRLSRFFNPDRRDFVLRDLRLRIDGLARQNVGSRLGVVEAQEDRTRWGAVGEPGPSQHPTAP